MTAKQPEQPPAKITEKSGTEELVPDFSALLPMDAASGQDAGKLTMQVVFSSMLPPDLLKQYGDIIPGLDQKLIDAWDAERTLRHERVRHKMRLESVEHNAFKNQANAIMISVISSLLAFFVVGGLLMYHGHIREGIALFCAPMGVGFLGNWISSHRERRKK